MSITTLIGPMFSGKTSELIRLIKRKQIAGKQCLIIKHSDDNRFDNIVTDHDCTTNSYNRAINNHITTHDKICYSNCDIIYLTEFNEFARVYDQTIIEFIIKKYDTVGIDEGFFFKGINKFCNVLADNGIDVFVATLESSYKQELFQEIGDLISRSENVIKFNGICMRCKKLEASFTIRIVESDEQILVGGSEKYQCVCRACLIDFHKQKEQY